MHVETRIIKGKKKYYLAYAYRVLGKVKKIRAFLGTDLSKAVLSKKIRDTEKILETKITEAKKVRDPYSSALSPTEIGDLRTLESRGKIELSHLSENDW